MSGLVIGTNPIRIGLADYYLGHENQLLNNLSVSDNNKKEPSNQILGSFNSSLIRIMM